MTEPLPNTLPIKYNIETVSAADPVAPMAPLVAKQAKSQYVSREECKAMRGNPETSVATYVDTVDGEDPSILGNMPACQLRGRANVMPLGDGFVKFGKGIKGAWRF